MKHPEIFAIEKQWKLYLSRVALVEENLIPAQRREMKRAFYGAVGQFLLIMRDDLPNYIGDDDDKGVDVLEGMLEEVATFWEGEGKKIAGIVVDDYKVEAYKRELTKHGFAFEIGRMTPGISNIKVTYEGAQVNQIQKICKKLELGFKRSN